MIRQPQVCESINSQKGERKKKRYKEEGGARKGTMDLSFPSISSPFHDTLGRLP